MLTADPVIPGKFMQCKQKNCMSKGLNKLASLLQSMPEPRQDLAVILIHVHWQGLQTIAMMMMIMPYLRFCQCKY